MHVTLVNEAAKTGTGYSFPSPIRPTTLFASKQEMNCLSPVLQESRGSKTLEAFVDLG